MNTSTRSTARTVGVAVRAMALFTVLLGLGYTAVLTVVGQVALPAQANGSLIDGPDGASIGSSLIGQAFTDADGAPLPQYFQSRPSAAGDGYDAGASSGSNLGPENDDLIAAITERREQVAAFNDVAPDDVPADAVTASSSGLDPHISPAYAEIQIERVAAERGIPAADLRSLVQEHTDGPRLGYLGDGTVNVLELNVALDQR